MGGAKPIPRLMGPAPPVARGRRPPQHDQGTTLGRVAPGGVVSPTGTIYFTGSGSLPLANPGPPRFVRRSRTKHRLVGRKGTGSCCSARWRPGWGRRRGRESPTQPHPAAYSRARSPPARGRRRHRARGDRALRARPLSRRGDQWCTWSGTLSSIEAMKVAPPMQARCSIGLADELIHATAVEEAGDDRGRRVVGAPLQGRRSRTDRSRRARARAFPELPAAPWTATAPTGSSILEVLHQIHPEGADRTGDGADRDGAEGATPSSRGR